MNILYIEENVPELIFKAIQFINRQQNPWVVCAPFESREFAKRGIAIREPSELVSGLYDHSVEEFTHINKQFSAFISKPHGGVEGEAPAALPREGATRAPIIDAQWQESVRREVFYFLVPVAHSRAFANGANKADPVIVCTRWPEIHDRLDDNASKVKTISPGAVCRRIRKAFMPLYLEAHHLISCIRASVQRDEKMIGAARAGVIAGVQPNQQQQVHMEDLFRKFQPKEIYYHLRGSSTCTMDRGQFRAFRSRMSELGWNFWCYRDANFMRATQAVLQSFGKVPALLFQKKYEWKVLVTRAEILLRHWEWEVMDMFKYAPLRVLVDSAERDPSALITAEVARRHRCVTVNVFNGFIHERDPFHFPPPFDALFVWTEEQKKQYVQQGISGERVHVTGHLNEAEYLEYSKRRPPSSPAHPVVTYFSQRGDARYPVYREQISAILKELLEAVPALTLTIKLHPFERDGFLKRLWESEPRCQIVGPSESPFPLICKSILVIGAYSTVLLEALAIGVPIAVYDGNGFMNGPVREGAAIDLFHSSDPVGDIVRVLQERSRFEHLALGVRDYGRARLGIQDGRSRERMARIIEQLDA